MRIVHIFPTLNPGGAERMLVHILMHLDRSRFDVSAICLGRSNGSELEGLLAEAQVPVQVLGQGAGFDPRMFARVHRAVEAARPDVLHSHVHVLRYLFPYIKYSGWLGHRPRMLHTVHNLAAFEVEPRARWIQGMAFRNGVQPVAVAMPHVNGRRRRLGRLVGLHGAALVVRPGTRRRVAIWMTRFRSDGMELAGKVTDGLC